MSANSANVAHELRRQAAIKAKNIPRLQEIKRLLGCQHCGSHGLPYPRYHFHHEGRYRWQISRRKHRPWPDLVRELAETVLLCDRCHGWRTAGLLAIPVEVRVIVPAFAEMRSPNGVTARWALALLDAAGTGGET